VPEGLIFYTNFELGSISWFLNSGYMDYYNAIDKSAGIYIYRWGDTPIKCIGVSSLADPKTLWGVTDIAYQHGAIYNY
jgi:alpha 1,2-mannosyltransferase